MGSKGSKKPMGVYWLHVCYAQQKVYLTVYAKNFIGSSDICLMGFIYSA